MDDNTCLNCGNEFEKKNKGFKRKNIDINSKIPSVSFRKILTTLNEPITPDKKLFICDKCASTCVKLHNYHTSQEEFNQAKSASSYLGKRKRSLIASPNTASTPAKKNVSFPISPFSSPIRKRINTSTSSTISTSKSFIDKAIVYLKNYKYYTAFRVLLNKSRSAREALKKIVKDTVRKEIKNVNERAIHSLSSQLSQESINEFTWKTCLEPVELQLPVFTTAIKTALSSKNSAHKLSFDGKPGTLVPAYGFLMSTILRLRMPSKFTFLQDVLSVEMYRSGCNQKLFKWLNKLGLSKSVTGTRAVVDRLCNNFDTEIKKWKVHIQHDLGNFEEKEEKNLNDQSETELGSVSETDHESENDFSGSDVTDESIQRDDVDFDELDGIVPLLESSTIMDHNEIASVNDVCHQLDPGYSICWDNVQKLSVSRHTAANKNKMMLWALAFATKNRISFRHLDFNLETCPAVDIPLEKFLPSDDDWVALKNRMEIITQRILIKNFEAFTEGETEQHIHHQYYAESCVKSEIVNLGVIKENPSTCKGVISIMKELHKYVPVDGSGDPYPIVCHGDQLSVERMLDAKLAMAGCEHEFNKLAGLIPRPQGFHKRNIILQDAMNQFYQTKTAAVKGSLFQIRNKFEFRNVKRKTSDCINSCVDLWNFVTEGYICLLACKICQIKSLDECPEDLKATDINEYVKDLSSQIVQTIWPNIQCGDDLNKTTPYCEDNDTTFVYDEFDEDSEEENDVALNVDSDDDNTEDNDANNVVKGRVMNLKSEGKH